ncbi:MAG TPA: DinB family protein [Anaerolineae bacterium]|jgi:hypothetical protein
MTTKAELLADKLIAEGERTVAFFNQLSPDAWVKHVYAEGPGWKVRDAYEHLILSEETLLQLFEIEVCVGRGVDESYSIDAFNAEHTGALSSLSVHELATRYTVTRLRTAEFTRALTDEQLAIRARHPALGESPLIDQIKLIYVHHSMHVRDVKRSLA